MPPEELTNNYFNLNAPPSMMPPPMHPMMRGPPPPGMPPMMRGPPPMPGLHLFPTTARSPAGDRLARAWTRENTYAWGILAFGIMEMLIGYCVRKNSITMSIKNLKCRGSLRKKKIEFIIQNILLGFSKIHVICFDEKHNFNPFLQGNFPCIYGLHKIMLCVAK